MIRKNHSTVAVSLLNFSDRWKSNRLVALFAENKEINSNGEICHALQFKFGSIVPKPDTQIDDSLLDTWRKYTVVRPDDIIINGLNLNYDFVTFRVGLVPEEGIITSAYIVLRPREGVNAKYYHYYFEALDSQKIFHGLGTGIRLTLSYKELKNVIFPVPPRKEQDQIVRFLDWKVSSINKLILSCRNQIALLDEMKQRKIDEAVVKGTRNSTIIHNDDIRWNIYYPEHWQVRRIRELFSFRKGLSITKANLEETGIAVISYGQIHSKRNTGVSLNEDLFRYVNKSYLQTNKSCLVEKGDFIFADTSEDVIGCGNCAYIDRDGTIFAGYHSIIAHPSGSTNNKYLAYLFKSPTWRYQIRKKVNGVKVYSITQKMLKDTFVLIPPSDEQEEIAGYLDEICIKIDVAIQKLEEKISNLQDLKTRLISDVVTGQMDVRNITVPEYEHVDEISADGGGDASEESEDFNEEEA